jgi:uncharacterized protein YndB with AHSA1/START domain
MKNDAQRNAAPDDSQVLEREIRIAARPETVFSFFTDPLKLIRWKGINAKLAPRPHGIYRVDINGRDVARGEFLEIVPYSRIVFTWGWEGADSPLPPGASTVEVSLLADGDGTLVRLRHWGLPVPLQAMHGQGWDSFLPRLQMAVEGRDPQPDASIMPVEGGGVRHI